MTIVLGVILGILLVLVLGMQDDLDRLTNRVINAEDAAHKALNEVMNWRSEEK